LKHLLIKPLALLLLWISHISSQMITISNLKDILITWGFDIIDTLLKMWLFLRIVLKIIGIPYLMENTNTSINSSVIRFQLRKAGHLYVFGVNMICISYIFFNSLEIQGRGHLICSDYNTMLVHMNKICHNFWFDTLCYKTKVWTDFGRVRVRTEIGQ